jgi:mevalonate kinase
MPAIVASAPGKIILFGEHAVVYHRPAIAVPVTMVRAKASILPGINFPPGTIKIEAPDINLSAQLNQLAADHPIGLAVRSVLKKLDIDRPPALTLRITSTIPIAAGMGSGAAVSVAICRALSAFLGSPLPETTVSSLAYVVERLHHGNPSGIDNTVIAYGRPVYYIRGELPILFEVLTQFTLVIADTGVSSPTALAVSGVRGRWELDKIRFEALFDQIGALTNQAHHILKEGDPLLLGPLMNENHRLLAEVGVSSPELEKLVTAARQAGALGAKLAGGGVGGNMIALATPRTAGIIAQSLLQAGATHTIITHVGQASPL